MRRWLLIALLGLSSGCSTIHTLRDFPNPPQAFGGTRNHFSNFGVGALGKNPSTFRLGEAGAGVFLILAASIVDIPLSLGLDSVVLPGTVVGEIIHARRLSERRGEDAAFVERAEVTLLAKLREDLAKDTSWAQGMREQVGELLEITGEGFSHTRPSEFGYVLLAPRKAKFSRIPDPVPFEMRISVLGDTYVNLQRHGRAGWKITANLHEPELRFDSEERP